MDTAIEVYQPEHNIRVVTATSLFDGHDVSINIIRRMLQDTGVEVIHLGHNRSVRNIVNAAVQEDVQGIAVSSYQGGHLEFFKYMVDLLKDNGTSHIKVFGGGGGVIVPDEIRILEAYGVAKIYTPEDGTRMGLQGIINDMVKRMDFSTISGDDPILKDLSIEETSRIANLITVLEHGNASESSDLEELKLELSRNIWDHKPAIIGITGTGGAGKSSLTDELVLRFLNDFESATVAILSCDPSRRKTGGALLGDRIRMNAIDDPRVYMRSLATRTSRTELPVGLSDISSVLGVAGFDLIIIETAGIGQGDSNIVNEADVAIYTMTSEFGAASQLEKIDMLDYADIVVVNKFEKQGAEDALRDVRKQVQRNRKAFDTPLEAMPVFGTIASKFNDDGVTSLYHALLDALRAKTGFAFDSRLPKPEGRASTSKTIIIPLERIPYLSDIADTVRDYHHHTQVQADAVRNLWHLKKAADLINDQRHEATADDMRKAIADAEDA
ncbi:MAG: cobalamin-dependent protein, partial [Desulfobacterales bacterium]